MKLTKVNESIKFLNLISEATKECTGMEYKLDWEKRLLIETKKLNKIFPGFKVISSDSDRWRNYLDKDIDQMVYLKQNGYTDKEIAKRLNRTYWSVVYKLRELRKDGRL
ncbi:hypothetical protein [Bacillus methanolicus]|uniref:hypothetical protein n=1 Tax=Bacillus methanolicus TaxID=1471 RepID=UPI00200F060B|nr:hypothetical protein [Bacillus methanolicus]